MCIVTSGNIGCHYTSFFIGNLAYLLQIRTKTYFLMF